jgi:hypothetical protein
MSIPGNVRGKIRGERAPSIQSLADVDQGERSDGARLQMNNPSCSRHAL